MKQTKFGKSQNIFPYLLYLGVHKNQIHFSTIFFSYISTIHKFEIFGYVAYDNAYINQKIG